MNFTENELELIIAALTMMQDSDDEHGYPEQAAAARDLIDRFTQEQHPIPDDDEPGLLQQMESLRTGKL